MSHKALQVKAFFDEATFTISYVVNWEDSSVCAILDSVLDYDPKSGRTSTKSADQIIKFVTDKGLKTEWILETHVHADHLTASQYLKKKLGGKIAIGAQVPVVQEIFTEIFNLGPEFSTDGSQFDKLLADGETISLDNGEIRVMATPGHTPACVSYVIGDACFVGDTMFMPDFGSARCDFPGGDAKVLYQSTRKILSLPESTRLFMCHDYKAPGRDEYKWETTVAEQRAHNKHIKDGTSEADFVEMRTTRDKQLAVPVLLLPSVQINLRAGEFPEPESNGVSYIKIPMNKIQVSTRIQVVNRWPSRVKESEHTIGAEGLVNRISIPTTLLCFEFRCETAGRHEKTAPDLGKATKAQWSPLF